MSGMWYLISLATGAFIAILCASQMYSLQLIRKGVQSDAQILSNVFGKAIATAILLCGRIPFLLFASTGLLVTAGFAFNEIFVYWFPNFLFASILLVAVAVLNVFAGPNILKIQFVFSAITLLALGILIFMGIVREAPEAVPSGALANDNGLSFSLLALGIITFLGFDFLKIGDNPKIATFTIIGGLVLVSVWSVVALKFVDPVRLAESYISYMLVAKAIAGDLGRYIMGIGIISGVLSCVNALFIITRRLFSNLAEERVLPQVAKKSWAISITFALIIEVMMLTGFAGEDILEAQIYASIILWLFYIGIRTGVTVYVLKKEKIHNGGTGYAAGAAVLVILALLVFSNPQLIYIIKFIVMVLVGAVVLSLICTRVYGKYSLN